MRFGKSVFKTRLFFVSAILAIGLMVFAEDSRAEYPERDIRVIVAYKPGGGSDVRARLLASVIKKNQLLPVPLVITNIPGGGAAPGQRTVLEAAPDGYTLLVHHAQMITGHLLDLFEWTYTDFAPVAQLTENPLFLCTHEKSGLKSLADVFEAAKEKPGKIIWAWGGMGGHTHFASEAIFSQTDAKFRPLALAGAAEQKAALAGERIDVAIMGIIPMEYIKSGDVIPLGVTSNERIPQLPETPTLIEKGIDIDISIRYSVFAPKKTPEKKLEVLRDAIRKAVQTQNFTDSINKMGAVVAFRPGQEMFERYRKDYKIFESVVSEIKAAKKNK